VDITYYILKFLSWFHIVWDLRAPPAKLYEEAATVPVQPLPELQ
jgi:stearoyl-CoA desaturase (Delta-9 desaturase)